MASRWRASEDAQLTRLYAQPLPLRVIAQRLGRSEEAISARRKLLAISPRRAPVSWSERRDRLIILAGRAGVPATDIALQLGTSAEQVKARRRYLVGARTTARRYEPWEDLLITAAWRGELDVQDLARQLGRSPGALALRARALGLHQPPSRRRWSGAEDHALREGYSCGLSCEEISRLELPHRSTGAIAARARKLGVTSYARLWSRAEDERLRLLVAREAPIDQIALTLIRTPEAVRQRARKLALSAPVRSGYARNRRRWSRREDEILRTHPGAHPSTLSVVLQRSDQAIRQRQRALEIRSGDRSPHTAFPRTHRFSPAEDRLLQRELTDGSAVPSGRARALSVRLHRSPGELRGRAGQLRSPRNGAAGSSDATRGYEISSQR
jgi:hypothetical protein